MRKVKIVFDCRIKLWDFKQVFKKSVLQTILWKRSLTCLCTETEIELARHAYNARVEEVK
ncbi:MAG: hypothetical protein JWR72_807 [Flavisolibacter sp.]|nr:hypothetical protein [Flavisolibacter sp.]